MIKKGMCRLSNLSVRKLSIDYYGQHRRQAAGYIGDKDGRYKKNSMSADRD